MQRRFSAASRYVPVSRELAWVGLGQATAAAGGLAGVRLLTSVLPPSVYGELALAISLASLGQLIAWSPLSGAALRFFSSSRESLQGNSYLRAVRRLVVQATSALVALAFVICLGLWATGDLRWLGLAVAVLTFTVLSGYEATLRDMQSAVRHRKIVALHLGAGVWLRFLFARLFVAVLGATSTAAMFGFVIGAAAVLTSQFVFFRKRVLPLIRHDQPEAADSADPTSRMRSFAWPIAASGLFIWIPAVADRWVLQVVQDTASVGLYMALNQLGYYPMALVSAVTLQFASPLLFERAGDASDQKRLDQTWRLITLLLRVTLGVTIVATAGAWLLQDEVFSLLVGPGYRHISGLLPWMVLSGGLFACGQAASQWVMVAGKTRRLLLPRVATSLAGIGLYLLGAHLRGLSGVVYANVVFGWLYFWWMWALTKEARTRGLPNGTEP